MLSVLILETFSFAIILPSLLFLAISVYIFLRDEGLNPVSLRLAEKEGKQIPIALPSDAEGMQKHIRIGRKALMCIGVSPLCFILGCRLLAGAVIDLLTLIGLKNETVFLFIRIPFAVLTSIGLLIFCLMCYSRILGHAKDLSYMLYSSFICVAVIADYMPARITQTLTAIVLSAAMGILLFKEYSFLIDHEGYIQRIHFILPTVLTFFLVIGLLNQRYILLGILLSESPEYLQTYAWSSVMAFFMLLLELFFEKTIISGYRENYEAKEHQAEVEKLNRELLETQDKLIQAFAEILESKSGQSGHHVRRVSEYSALICESMGCDKETVHRIRIAAMMHDCGKLMIPNEILEKPGRLTDEEFNEMKQHVYFGEMMLKNVPGETMHEACLVATQHHERWDGKGYLKHLKGEQIALSSQIVAVADVFDALTSKRCYKEAWKPEEAREEIIKNRGTQFSEAAVDAFEKCYDRFLTVMETYADPEDQSEQTASAIPDPV
ncbi:MAG: HD domain-containing protein [Lachnospiraceae bacterium]|nr:HD domain-containing protein [Lachnospiraceae bacterium]